MNIQILHLLDGARKATGIAVIIDVFRAFTVEAYVMNNGAARLLPVGGQGIAYDMKKSDSSCVLIGERQGRMLPGFDYGNSPSQIMNIDFSGKTVVHTTSAGTQGIVSAQNASEIITGSLVNAKAIAEYIRRKNPEMVSLVCMGLSAKVQTEEDNLCACYIKSLLEGTPIELHDEIQMLKRTSGRKFFEKAKQNDFPEADFYLCTEADRFPFIMKVVGNQEGMRRIEKINVLP